MTILKKTALYPSSAYAGLKHGQYHYDDVIMSAIASQITSLTIVYSIIYSDADQRKHQSSASLAFVRGIHRGPVNSPHKWPVTRKMFPFDDVIMFARRCIRKERYQPNSRRNIDYKIDPLYSMFLWQLMGLNYFSLTDGNRSVCLMGSREYWWHFLSISTKTVKAKWRRTILISMRANIF